MGAVGNSFVGVSWTTRFAAATMRLTAQHICKLANCGGGRRGKVVIIIYCPRWAGDHGNFCSSQFQNRRRVMDGSTLVGTGRQQDWERDCGQSFAVQKSRHLEPPSIPTQLSRWRQRGFRAGPNGI